MSVSTLEKNSTVKNLNKNYVQKVIKPVIQPKFITPAMPARFINDRSWKDIVCDTRPWTSVSHNKMCDINAVDATSTPKSLGKIAITVDSGAAESVIPTKMLPQIPMQPPTTSTKDIKYVVANGQVVHNEGQKKIHMRVNGGPINSMNFQCTNVRKPLASVSRIVAKGNRVVFDNDESYIENKRTGKKVKLELEGGTYVMNVELLDMTGQDPNESGFIRPR